MLPESCEKKNEFNDLKPLCVNKMYQILSEIFEISFIGLIRIGDCDTNQEWLSEVEKVILAQVSQILIEFVLFLMLCFVRQIQTVLKEIKKSYSCWLIKI